LRGVFYAAASDAINSVNRFSYDLFLHYGPEINGVVLILCSFLHIGINLREIKNHWSPCCQIFVVADVIPDSRGWLVYAVVDYAPRLAVG
jgi:hypothetical protein